MMFTKFATARKWRRTLLWATAIIGASALCLAIFPREGARGAKAAESAGHETATSAAAVLVPGTPDTLRVAPAAVKSMGVQVVKAHAVSKPRLLELQGSLALDTNQLVRVHSRFSGEVIEISETTDYAASYPGQEHAARAVGFGDRVTRGQLLTVVWCKDLGEKKSELADALSQLSYDRDQLSKLNAAAGDGAVSEARVKQQERGVEADLTAVARAERTLRVWRLSETEIAAVKQEAERIRVRKGKRDPEAEKNWARVEVRAPLDGIVVEKNVSMGDIIDTTSDLFKVANVDSLTVWANAYEENLPALLDLPKEKMRWTVRLSADRSMPPLSGAIDKIGYVSDPAQHTVMVMGRVTNPGGRLRAGQFITATVEMPPSAQEVVVPASALIEDGRESIIFMQPDVKEPRYAMRRVAVAWRSPSEVHLRSVLTPEDSSRGLSAVKPGEQVVAAAAIQLRSALDDLTTSGKAD
jgi:membrane fusion protein, heavy metal efflux system